MPMKIFLADKQDITRAGLMYVCNGIDGVECKDVDRVLKGFVFTGPDVILTLVHMLKERGLEDKLRSIGVKDGDVVRVAGIEFDFVE